MTQFAHGARARAYWHTLDLSPYMGEVTVSFEVDTDDIEPFGTWKEAVAGHLRAVFTLNGWYDPNGAGVWDAIANEDSPRPLLYLPQGDAVGEVGFGGVITLNRVGGNAPQGAVRFPVAALGATAVDLVRVLRSLGSGGTSPGSAVDHGSSTSAGGAAYLICTSLTGSSPQLSVIVQHSSDNLNWNTLVAMTPLTAAGSEVKTVSGTVNRYLRVSWTLTGTGASATWTLAFGRR